MAGEISSLSLYLLSHLIFSFWRLFSLSQTSWGWSQCQLYVWRKGRSYSVSALELQAVRESYQGMSQLSQTLFQQQIWGFIFNWPSISQTLC